MHPSDPRAGVRRYFRLALRRPDAVAQEVDEEIATHLELRTEQLVRRGLSEREARAEAERRFGALDAARARMRESAGRREARLGAAEALDALRQDARLAWRGVRRAPTVAATIVLTLALGIAGATAMFTVVHGVLLRPLPYAAPDALVAVHTRWGSLNVERGNLSEPEYRDVRALPAIGHVALYDDGGLTVTGVGEPERLDGVFATASLFETLGTRPALGRTFTAAEDRRGADGVVVLGHAYWRRRFGGDRGVVGRTMIADGTPRTIVGVMPAAFTFGDADVYVPLALDPADLPSRGAHNFSAVARLAPGATVAQAGAQLDALAARLRAAYPDNYAADAGFGAHAIPLREAMVGDVRRALLVLAASVGVVLLIACANAANLLLVRGEVRQRELAVRAALGAGRGRVVRQLLTESALLAVAAGALGLLGASWGVRALLAVNPDALPRREAVAVDATVAAVALALSLLTGLLFGTLPALRASRPDLQGVLRRGGRTASARGDGRLRRTLVVGEIALAVVVVVSAGLLLRSFRALRSVDAGLDTTGVLTVSTSLPPARYPNARVEPAWASLVARVRALPGVQHAGAVWLLPLSGSESNWDVEVEGRPRAPGAPAPSPRPQFLTPGALAAMRVPVLRGRGIEAADDARAPLVALVNETMARTLWPGADVVGRRFRMSGDSTPWIRVVGVTRDVRSRGLAERPVMEFAVPHAQFTTLTGGSAMRNMRLVVRTAGDPARLTGPVTREIRAFDPDLAVSDARTLRQVVDTSVAQPRFTMLLLGVFGAVALVLAAVGVYGVLSFAVAQRTRELGIRVALGARRADIVRLVLRHGLGLAGAGVALGVAGALGATRALSALLYGVSPTDPLTFGVIALVLLGVSAAATLAPARRATRADPMGVLRAE